MLYYSDDTIVKINLTVLNSISILTIGSPSQLGVMLEQLKCQYIFTKTIIVYTYHNLQKFKKISIIALFTSYYLFYNIQMIQV